MTKKTRLHAAAAATAACLLLFAGCGSDSDSDDDAKDSDTTSQEDTTSDDADDASEDADDTSEAAEAPDGYEMVTAEGAGLEFAAPEDWEEFSQDDLDGKDEELEDAAKGMNMTVDQLKQLMTQVDVMLLDDEGNNVNVVLPPGVTELPDESTLTSQFQALNAEVGEITDVETPLGTGRQITYTLQGKHGVGLFVEVTKGVANLTVTMADEQEAQSLMDDIIPTLSDVG